MSASSNLSGDDPMGLLGPRFTAHVPVPTQKDVEAALLRKRKMEILEKYGMEEDETFNKD